MRGIYGCCVRTAGRRVAVLVSRKHAAWLAAICYFLQRDIRLVHCPWSVPPFFHRTGRYMDTMLLVSTGGVSSLAPLVVSALLTLKWMRTGLLVLC